MKVAHSWTRPTTCFSAFSCSIDVRKINEERFVTKSLAKPNWIVSATARTEISEGFTKLERTMKKTCDLDALKREAHKYYDEAVITVRAGKGGNGQIVADSSGKYVRNFKYTHGRQTPKKLWLPSSPPADGGDGGDVVFVCDPALDALLHFHEKNLFTAKKGPNGNPEEGTQAPKALKPTKRPKHKAPALEIGVPPGTVVKRKGSGKFLGELTSPGERLIIARGGSGGLGAVMPSKKKDPKPKRTLSQNRRRNLEIETIEVEDDWKMDSRGQPGEEFVLQLLLRVVADVGFVGLPNCGKSSLLKALSRASPEIAPYPFTTLIPNLGVMGKGGDPVLVDLPGLIEGAHIGKGLGRNFLRHLRRTRILLQVVDASLPDPVSDYQTIREELRMYNPQYCERTHFVALNKIDLIQSQSLCNELVFEIRKAAERYKETWETASLPEEIIPTSALNGDGIDVLQSVLQQSVKEKIEENERFEKELESTENWNWNV